MISVHFTKFTIRYFKHFFFENKNYPKNNTNRNKFVREKRQFLNRSNFGFSNNSNFDRFENKHLHQFSKKNKQTKNNEILK